MALGPGQYTTKDAASINGAFAVGLELCLIECAQETVIVVSQSCDIAQRGLVTVAPVMPLGTIPNTDRRQAVRRRQVNYLVYLPEHPDLGFPESFAHLSFLATMLPAALSLDRRLLSLSDLGRHTLVFQVAHFFSRPVL